MKIPADQRRRLGWLLPLLVLLGLSLLGVAAHLTDELIEGESFALDGKILLALRQPGQPDLPIGPLWLQQSAIDISALGGFTLLWLFGLAGLAYLLLIRKRAEAISFGASLIGSSLLNTLLKQWLHRPRPELVPHLVQVSTASFPSGHAMTSAAVYLTLALMLGEAQPGRFSRIYLLTAATLVVFLIGCTRVYLGVHWPSDVLAGWCFGSCWALMIYFFYRHFRRPRTDTERFV